MAVPYSSHFLIMDALVQDVQALRYFNKQTLSRTFPEDVLTGPLGFL